MQLLLTIFAVGGFAMVLFRLLRSVVSILRWAADAFLARETASTRARRGDLTGMSEAERRAAGARRARWRALAALALWSGLLALPPLTPVTRWLYAAYLPGLWLLGRIGRPHGPGWARGNRHA